MADKLRSLSHPGAILAEWLKENKISRWDFSVHINVEVATVSALVAGKVHITPYWAIKLEQATRVPFHLWMSLQKNWDEERLEKEAHTITPMLPEKVAS